MSEEEIKWIGYLLFGILFVVLPLGLVGVLYVAIMDFIDDIRFIRRNKGK